MNSFSVGDKIKIHDGFKLSKFEGDYSKEYIVLDCFVDETHGVEFVEFMDSGVKYCYPTAAFDLV